MLTVYLAALAFGLVLIGASLFAGHGDTDSGTDVHGDGAQIGHDLGDGTADAHGGGHDAHGHGDGHANPLSSLLSVRFWTYALGAFGMTGTALVVAGLPAPLHVPIAGAMGVTIGGGAAWLFRKLRLASAGTPVSTDSLLGKEAEVVLPLASERLGKVRMRIGEQDVEFPARGSAEDTLDNRSRVIVVRFRDGVAEVRPAPWKE